MKSFSLQRTQPRGWRLEVVQLEDRTTPSGTPEPLLHMGPDQFPSPNLTDGLSPNQIRTAYGIDAIPKFGGTTTANGAGETIAIVDAYNDPDIANDLAAFDSYYGTPANGLNATPVASFFKKVGQNGGAVPANAPLDSWAGEESLDVEYVHSIAPAAKIILVETNNPNTLDAGDIWAEKQPGITVISNSWGGSEYPSEQQDEDGNFVTPAGHAGVTFLFSSGDSGFVSYPAASSNVVAVGATDLYVDASGDYQSETAWSFPDPNGGGSGGGDSQYEPVPSYQANDPSVASVVGAFRGVPDVSMVGGYATPLWVYDSYDNGATTPWAPVYGTSAACPQWAGIIALIDQGRSVAGLGSLNGLTQTLPNLYALASNPTTYASDFHNVTVGSDAETGVSAGIGYNLVTGLGTPVANKLVPDMIGYSATSLVASPTNLPDGGSVTLTISVTGPLATPTGTVDIMVGSTDLGPVNLVNGTATLTTTAFPKGVSTITATYSGDTTYTTSSATTSVDLGVADSTTTVTSPDTEVTYGDNVPLTASVTGIGTPSPSGQVTFTSGSLNLGTMSLVNGAVMINTSSLPAGTDTVSVSYPGDSNYAASTGTFTVIVLPAKLTIAANPESFEYGGTFPANLTYQPPSGLVNGDTASVLSGELSTTATPTSGFGSYPITQGTLSAGNNYTLTVTPSTLTITAATLTITANNESFVYGETFPQLTYQSPVGLVNGDTASSVLTGSLSAAASATSGVGDYSITDGTLSAGANYTLTVVPATLSITPAPLTVTANSLTSVYGGLFPATLSYATQGLENGDTAASVLTGQLTTTASPNSGVGNYPITGGTLAATDNYTLTVVPAKLAITPATLTITANNAVIQNDGALPSLTYTVTGLVNGDFSKVVSGVVLSTPATAFSAVGTYPITVSGGQAANYTLMEVSGTLTIEASSRLVGTSDYAVGSNDGSGTAIIYNAAGSVVTTITPFPGFTGAIRVAVADFNGDGTPDYIFGTGPGALAQVLVLNGTNLQPLFDVLPFQGFTGGVFVAAGDIDGDGTSQLVITPDQGGGPRVEIYHSGDGTPVADFYGINDSGFRGGARAAVGDLTHDGHADLVVAAGYGGGARVSVYSGAALAQGQLDHPVGDFFAFPNVIRNGVYVAIGDVNGDGYGDLIIGAGAGGGPNVLILNGRTLLTQGAIDAIANPIANFFAGSSNNRDGVPVATKDIVGSGSADVVTGEGGGGTLTTVYSGASLAAGNLNPLYTLDPFQNSLGGVDVG